MNLIFEMKNKKFKNFVITISLIIIFALSSIQIASTFFTPTLNTSKSDTNNQLMLKIQYHPFLISKI